MVFNFYCFRDVPSLKKMFNKLKSDSKVYKAKQRCNVMGTGGGPSTVKDEPILAEVLTMIGQGGVGIEGVNDSDMEFHSKGNF